MVSKRILYCGILMTAIYYPFGITAQDKKPDTEITPEVFTEKPSIEHKLNIKYPSEITQVDIESLKKKSRIVFSESTSKEGIPLEIKLINSSYLLGFPYSTKEEDFLCIYLPPKEKGREIPFALMPAKNRESTENLEDLIATINNAKGDSLFIMGAIKKGNNPFFVYALRLPNGSEINRDIPVHGNKNYVLPKLYTPPP